MDSKYTVAQRLAFYREAYELIRNDKAYFICYALAMATQMDYNTINFTIVFPEFWIQRPSYLPFIDSAWFEFGREGSRKRLAVLLNCIDSCKKQIF